MSTIVERADPHLEVADLQHHFDLGGRGLLWIEDDAQAVSEKIEPPAPSTRWPGRGRT